MFRKIKRYIKDPYYALGYDMIKKCPKLMTDEFYLRVLWRMLMEYELDLNNPQTFNEKLQWLKLHDHNPLCPTLVDKYRVKQYVAERIGKEHVIPTLAVYRSVDEIDLDKLPNQFVLKCNHDSGSVVICRDKSKFDIEKTKNKLEKCLKHNFYWDAREWAYKHVKPVIFAEQYMEDSSLHDLPDYKFFAFDGVVKDLLTYKFLCFNGEPYLCYVTVKNESIWENYYDLNFKPLNIHRDFPNSSKPLAKPKSYDEMIVIARTLSQGMPHVRLDLYEVNGIVYFSEYTFYDWGGYAKFTPNSWDKLLGDKIILRK